MHKYKNQIIDSLNELGEKVNEQILEKNEEISSLFKEVRLIHPAISD